MINKFVAVSLILKNSKMNVLPEGVKEWACQIGGSSKFIIITKRPEEIDYAVSLGGSLSQLAGSYMKAVGIASSIYVETANMIIKTRSRDVAIENTGRTFSYAGREWRISGYSASSDKATVVPNDNPLSGGFEVSSEVFMKNIIIGNVKFL